MKSHTMKMNRISLAICLTILISGSVIPFHAVPADSPRKVAYKMSDKKKTRSTDRDEMTAGSFMVASQCDDCNNGYTLDQAVFAGYDKNQNADVESFFITNKTDRHMTAVTLYIEYITTDSLQLHKQFVKLKCNIPPGETRKADIKAWDTQHSFHYIKSKPSRSGGTPFDIRFDPVAFYLRF